MSDPNQCLTVRTARLTARCIALLIGLGLANRMVMAQQFQSVEQLLRGAVANGTIGAGVVLIARNDTVLYRAAVGEIEPGIPMPTDAIARLASITKPITATAILLLVEEGKIQLSDRVDHWFPGFGTNVQQGGQTVPASRPVTIRDLLTHQAGLASSGASYDSLFSVATAAEFARRIGAMPLRFQPGAGFEYGCCGSAYEVLGAIVEKVSGQRYSEFLQARVLGPLGMKDTYFNVPLEKRPRLATQFRRDGSGVLVPFRTRGQEDEPTEFYSGAGGLRSTVDDYYRFTTFLLNGGVVDRARLLSSESVRAMTMNQVGLSYPTVGYGWGYGVRVRTSADGDGLESVGSFGWNGGTGTLFLVDPVRRITFIMLLPTNPGTPGVSALRNAIVSAGYRALLGAR
jgi:CubicO group peptidase (beta-lactamase class C family)